MKQLSSSILLAMVLGLYCLSSATAQDTRQLFLSGHGKDDAVPWNFLCTTGAQSGFWTNLPVPSNWEMHGFGTLNYHRDLTNFYDERGLYEHEFLAPADWVSRRVFLVFEGAMTDTSAQLNGQTVGPIHQGGFYRFKYEITSLIKMGATNKLEVTVAKHSANASVNGAERGGDYWMFGGIFRPVHLDAVPLQFIDRVAVDARADGNFSADVFLDGVTDADSVEAQIQTLAGKNVGNSFSKKIVGPTLKLKTFISKPNLWSSETPNLYRVEIRLKRGAEIVHRVTQHFGFRTFEVRDGDGLYLNGRKLILKGVNRHSFWPDSGRCLSETVHRLDIATIKDMNANAVRMAHYPPDAEFLDLCDELGLYVLDELAGWHKHYDDVTGKKLVAEMVARDVNHPSIIFWDNGNEGGFNTSLDQTFGEFDPQQRRVLHPWAAFNGLCTAHYLAYDKAEIAATGKAVYFKAPDQELVATNDRTKYIYLPTEFQHGLFDGGAGAGLADYWRMMMSHPRCAGGFIWSFLDEGVRRVDGTIDVVGNQAPDGIVGPYREREASFYAIRQIWSPTPPAKKSTALARHDAILNFAKSPPRVTNAVVQITETPAKINVTVGDLTAFFSKRSGRLTGVWQRGEKFPLTDGPRVDGADSVPQKISIRTNREAAIVSFNCAGALKKIIWRVEANGWLRCDYTYAAKGTNNLFGVLFNYPEQNVQAKGWLGDGPFRVWKNRLGGNAFGVWSNRFNNTITGWRGWEYPEFKGFFNDVRWLQLETSQGLITIVPEKIPFTQVLTPEFPPTNLVRQAFAKVPNCGLGLLDAIPPIGSSTKKTADLGPQSQLAVGHGEHSHRVSFYFGALP